MNKSRDRIYFLRTEIPGFSLSANQNQRGFGVICLVWQVRITTRETGKSSLNPSDFIGVLPVFDSRAVRSEPILHQPVALCVIWNGFRRQLSPKPSSRS